MAVRPQQGPPGVDVLIDSQAIAAYRGREVPANARKAE